MAEAAAPQTTPAELAIRMSVAKTVISMQGWDRRQIPMPVHTSKIQLIVCRHCPHEASRHGVAMVPWKKGGRAYCLGCTDTATMFHKLEGSLRRLQPRTLARLALQISGMRGLDDLPFCDQCGGERRAHADDPPHLATGCTGYERHHMTDAEARRWFGIK